MTTVGDEDQTVTTGSLNRKQWVAAGAFALLAVYLATIEPTVDIARVSAILLFTIHLFAFENNIPVMFAVLTMHPDMSTSQWLLVTLTAGVALMGQARGKYTFFSEITCTLKVTSAGRTADCEAGN